MIEHEQSDRRRQVAVQAFGIDGSHQIGEGHVPIVGDILESLPERVLKTDAGLGIGDHNRSFGNRELHRRSPGSIRWLSSVWRSLSRSAAVSARCRLEAPLAWRFSAA